jgi:hypothetical protein
MASYKNLSSDWYIDVDNGVGTIYINGNLDVTGNITYVTEIAVNDAFIIVAANNTGTVTDMGLIAQKTGNTYAGLRYDTTVGAWQISASVAQDGSPISSYANIASGGGSGIVAGSNTQVQFNDNGTFGATANLTFDNTSNKLTISGHEVLSNIGTAPTAVANSVAIYNNAPGAGATGLYTVGTTTTADEVISLTRARLYAIIF